MAAIAAGVAVAATAAATAYSASQSAKAAGNAPGAPGLSRWEATYNKGTKDIFDEERGVIEQAVAEGNLIQPEIYRLLGYEPVYDNPDGPDLADLSNRLRDAQNRVNVAQQKMRDLKHQPLRKNGGTLRASAKNAQLQALKKERRIANQDAAELQQQLSDAQTTGRRIVGLKPLESGFGDPTGSKDNLFRVSFDLENEALARALKGEEPLDATLKTAYDEKERVLRERLRRQLGPDYETSTAGAEALANFDRERGEAFSQYNMKATELYATLTSQRAVDLSNLTGQRIQQLLAPSTAAAQRGTWVGQAGQDRLQFTQSQQRERALQFQGDVNKWKGEMAAAEARGQMAGAAASGLGALAGGIGSAASGAGGIGALFGGGGSKSNPYTGSNSVSSLLSSSNFQPAAGGLNLTA